MEELLKELIGEPDSAQVKDVKHANLLCEIKMLRRALALLAAAQIRQSYGGAASFEAALHSVISYVNAAKHTKWCEDITPTGDRDLQDTLGRIEKNLDNIDTRLL